MCVRCLKEGLFLPPIKPKGKKNAPKPIPPSFHLKDVSNSMYHHSTKAYANTSRSADSSTITSRLAVVLLPGSLEDIAGSRALLERIWKLSFDVIALEIDVTDYCFVNYRGINKVAGAVCCTFQRFNNRSITIVALNETSYFVGPILRHWQRQAESDITRFTLYFVEVPLRSAVNSITFDVLNRCSNSNACYHEDSSVRDKCLCSLFHRNKVRCCRSCSKSWWKMTVKLESIFHSQNTAPIDVNVVGVQEDLICSTCSSTGLTGAAHHSFGPLISNVVACEYVTELSHALEETGAVLADILGNSRSHDEPGDSRLLKDLGVARIVRVYLATDEGRLTAVGWDLPSSPENEARSTLDDGELVEKLLLDWGNEQLGAVQEPTKH